MTSSQETDGINWYNSAQLGLSHTRAYTNLRLVLEVILDEEDTTLSKNFVKQRSVVEVALEHFL